MPVQVDDGGGAALLRTIEDMGLSVHTGVGTQEVTVGEDGRVGGMSPSDGSSLPDGSRRLLHAAYAPGTNWPATAVWRSARAAASSSTRSAAPPTGTSSR